MQDGSNERAECEDEGAGNPLLVSGSRAELIIVDLEGFDLFALAAVRRAERGIRFTQSRGFRLDLYEFRSQGRGLCFEHRESKSRWWFRFQIAGGNPPDLAFGGLDVRPTLAGAEHREFVAGFDASENLELCTGSGAEIEPDISANPTDIGGRRGQREGENEDEDEGQRRQAATQT